MDAREPFRAVSVVAPACVAQVKGFRSEGLRDGARSSARREYARLGEGFGGEGAGKVIVGTPDGPKVLELA